MKEFVHSIAIKAPPAAVLDAFFDADALAAWWEVSRAVCIPRALGSYAVEWEPTEWRDDVLGRLGGAFHGTVVEFTSGREFFIADLYWHPPDGEPIGPMALEATCTPQGDGTLLSLRHSGYDNTSARWTRHLEIMSNGWMLALGTLKTYLEERWND
jgi:uncharacterized protein YndB with AHSA1/START domain